HMTQRIGDAPLIAYVVVLEAVVVQSAVAPGMGDSPTRGAGLVVVVVEGQAGATSVAHHVMLVVGECVWVAQRVDYRDQITRLVILIAHEDVAELLRAIHQCYLGDAARIVVDEFDAPPGRLVDSERSVISLDGKRVTA